MRKAAVEQQVTFQRDEVIEKSLLLSLAILAEANGRSVVEELNIAVSSYVRDKLPQELGKGILPLFPRFADTVMRESAASFSEHA